MQLFLKTRQACTCFVSRSFISMFFSVKGSEVTRVYGTAVSAHRQSSRGDVSEHSGVGAHWNITVSSNPHTFRKRRLFCKCLNAAVSCPNTELCEADTLVSLVYWNHSTLTQSSQKAEQTAFKAEKRNE